MEHSLIDQFADAIKQDPKEKKTTYSAIVSRIDEEGIIWVYVAGSDNDTPTAQTGVEVKKGDNVTVEWRNNKLYIAGNYSNPSAGVERVQDVETAAKVANEAAESAVLDASRARDAAEQAEEEASRAQDTADEVGRIADRAEQIATDAQTSADSAHKSANSATYSLSEVERVVDALGWISQHATYTLTTDTEIVDGKWYFAYNQGSYVITSPESNPSQEGLYELDSVDSAISNYIMAHVYLDGLGLHIRMSDSDGSQIVLTGTSIYMLNSNSDIIAEYAGEVVLGDRYGAHIELSPTYGLSFYDTAKQQGESGEPLNRIAYMQQDRLFIRSATLTSNLQIGNFRWVVLEHRTSLKYNPLS